MSDEMTERAKWIQSLLALGFGKDEAEFVADIELGILPRGDLIEVPDETVEKQPNHSAAQ